MNKYFLLLLFLLVTGIAAQAQVTPFPAAPISGNGAPSGSCGVGVLYTDNLTGTVYTCTSGTWTTGATASCISIANMQCVIPGGSIQSAITACAGACDVYVEKGVNIPTVQIPVTNTLWIHGAGMGQTIIQPSAALASALFSVSASNVSVKFSDLTIDMSNVPAITAIILSNVKKPIIENVQILYPTNGTGTALSMVGVAEMHARNLIMFGAGICIDENGNASGENFYDDVVCEDPGAYGYRRQQTTSSDVGGEYLTHFKVTNPDNRTTAQAFLVTSTVPAEPDSQAHVSPEYRRGADWQVSGPRAGAVIHGAAHSGGDARWLVTRVLHSMWR